MRVMSCLRRYLGVNVLCVLQRELGDAAKVPCLQEGIECRILAEEEVLRFAEDPGLELRAEWVRRASAEGGVCLGALESGRLIAYNWLAYADTPYKPGVYIELHHLYRYSYKTFVRPEYRGRRIAQALHVLADHPGLRGGKRFALNLVEIDNTPSLCALERAGSRRVGYAGFARCFGGLLTFRSPAVRRAGIRFYRPTARRIAARMRSCQQAAGT